MEMVRLTLAVVARVPLGEDRYLLAINHEAGNNPNAPLLCALGDVLASTPQSLKRLHPMNASHFDGAHLSFMLPENKVADVRQWFVTGADRTPDFVRSVLATQVPYVDFKPTEPIGIVRHSWEDPETQRKTIMLAEVHETTPTDYGMDMLGKLLLGRTMHVATATRAEIESQQLHPGGGSIDLLAAEALSPRSTYIRR